MKSMPASSARRASGRQSGQLADQRSGTLVAARPEEQLAPKMPILSALPLYRLVRSRIDAVRASKAFSIGRDSIVPPGSQPVNAPPQLSLAGSSLNRHARRWAVGFRFWAGGG